MATEIRQHALEMIAEIVRIAPLPERAQDALQRLLAMARQPRAYLNRDGRDLRRPFDLGPQAEMGVDLHAAGAGHRVAVEIQARVPRVAQRELTEIEVGMLHEEAPDQVVRVGQAVVGAAGPQEQTGILDPAAGQHEAACPDREAVAGERAHGLDVLDPAAAGRAQEADHAALEADGQIVGGEQRGPVDLAEAGRRADLKEQVAQPAVVEAERRQAEALRPGLDAQIDPLDLAQGGRLVVIGREVGQPDRPARMGHPGPGLEVHGLERPAPE